MSEQNEFVRSVAEKKYEFGFTTDVHTEIIEKGLNEEVIRLISQKKEEPEWLLQFRLDAYRYWLTQTQPTWGHVHLPEIDYQAISYYADPTAKKAQGAGSKEQEIDPELMKTFDKLGIPLEERLALSGTAVDAVMDSVSVKTTFKEKLSEKGIIFCSISEAVKNHPELVRQYLGSVVPPKDNYFAALNSAVFSDGSFVYIPKNTRCPMELSTYFRINARNTGQFERTLIVCDEGSYVSYLEGCTAPMRDENQLHAAIVEIVVMDNAEVKYSTVQNWYPGDAEGRGGVLNLVTKRGDLRGANSKLSWTQVETGSAITWKYPSCVLRGDNSQAEFYSVAVTNNHQEADTGTKMIHIGKNTRSTIISKGISAGKSQNSYRGLVRVGKQADGARNYSSCDSLLLGSQCGAHTFPYMDIHNNTATVEHEATTSKINEDQLFYCNQRRPHRQRLCQGRAQQAPHGIRRRGPEAPQRLPRGNGGLAVVVHLCPSTYATTLLRQRTHQQSPPPKQTNHQPTPHPHGPRSLRKAQALRWREEALDASPSCRSRLRIPAHLSHHHDGGGATPVARHPRGQCRRSRRQSRCTEGGAVAVGRGSATLLAVHSQLLPRGEAHGAPTDARPSARHPFRHPPDGAAPGHGAQRLQGWLQQSLPPLMPPSPPMLQHRCGKRNTRQSNHPHRLPLLPQLQRPHP